MNDVIVKVGLAGEHRARAAQLYYTAFRQKLHPIFRDERSGLTVLEQSLDGSHAIVAVSGGELVGIAGFKDADGSLVDIQPRIMVKAFGFVGGWARLMALSIFGRGRQPDTLLMDGIVVDTAARGGGIGSRLLDTIIEYARSHGYARVRLDVVDTNPRARQLYERKGFVPVRSRNYPYLMRLFSFSGSTTMIKTV